MHNIDLSLLDNNYNLTGYTPGDLTITKKGLTATLADDHRFYGDTNPAYTFGNVTFSGLANSETGSVIDSLSFTAPTATISSSAGSTHTINMALSDNNYNLLSYTSGTLTITKAPLVITADDLSRLEFQANPLLTASYNGLRNGDLQNVVSGLTLSTPATFNSIFGLYPIIASGGMASNYDISYVDGTLTVIDSDPPPPPSGHIFPRGTENIAQNPFTQVALTPNPFNQNLNTNQPQIIYQALGDGDLKNTVSFDKNINLFIEDSLVNFYDIHFDKEQEL